MGSDAFKTCDASNTVPMNSLKRLQGCGGRAAGGGDFHSLFSKNHLWLERGSRCNPQVILVASASSLK